MRNNILCSFFFLSLSLLWLILFGSGALLAESYAANTTVSLSGDSFATLARFKEAIIGGEILLPLVMSLLAGLLTSLSPCVYPLIPITLSIMGARKYQSHFQGFLVSLSYVFGMSVVYTVLGAVFASIGMVLGSFMQHPMVLLMLACLFIALSLSMLGVFNVVLPDRLMNRLTHIGGQGKKGAFLMGLVAGVLAAPCTGPILGFILTLIANNKDILFGSGLMFAFSLGMGAPFLLLGTFSSAITHMPKSGTWMQNIKYIFGAAMLGAAIYYMALVVPAVRSVLTSFGRLSIPLILISLAIGVALLLLYKHESRFARGLQTTMGAVISACAIATLLSYDLIGSKETTLHVDGLLWHVIDAETRDEQSFDGLLQQAKASGKPVLVDFYADWCVACKQLELQTLESEEVSLRLKEFLLIRIDSTKTSDYIAILQNRFKVFGLPTVVFIDKNGHELTEAKIQGFVKVQPFLEIIDKLSPIGKTPQFPSPVGLEKD